MWSSAQITNYGPDALVGSLVVCVCNLGPKNIAGFTPELLRYRLCGGLSASESIWKRCTPSNFSSAAAIASAAQSVLTSRRLSLII